MAFSSVLKKKFLQEGGFVVEEGTFSLASVTTGNIVADVTSEPRMVKIDAVEQLSSDTDSAALTYALDVTPRTLKITGANNDTGTYRIRGKAA